MKPFKFLDHNEPETSEHDESIREINQRLYELIERLNYRNSLSSWRRFKLAIKTMWNDHKWLSVLFVVST